MKGWGKVDNAKVALARVATTDSSYTWPSAFWYRASKESLHSGVEYLSRPFEEWMGLAVTYTGEAWCGSSDFIRIRYALP